MNNYGIEKFIPVGHDNGLTVTDLAMITGLDAREVRKHIAAARAQGLPILNMQDGQGYFFPAVNEDALIESCRMQELSRARNCQKNVKAMTLELKRRRGEL